MLTGRRDDARGLRQTYGLVGGGFIGLLVMLVAPYLRKSGAMTVPDFLAIRFGGDAVRAIALLVVLLISFPALAAAIAGSVFILARFLGVRGDIALDIVVVSVLFSTLLG